MLPLFWINRVQYSELARGGEPVNSYIQHSGFILLHFYHRGNIAHLKNLRRELHY